MKLPHVNPRDLISEKPINLYPQGGFPPYGTGEPLNCVPASGEKFKFKNMNTIFHDNSEHRLFALTIFKKLYHTINKQSTSEYNKKGSAHHHADPFKLYLFL